MTLQERALEVRKIVAEFAQQFYSQLSWQASQTVDGAELPHTSGDRHIDGEWLISHGLEPQEWLHMARVGADLVEEFDAGYVYEICQGMAEWLFAIPGMSAYSIPDEWADSPMGALWWAAYIRVSGDELITITDAAKIAGVTIQTISQRIDRGKLKAFIDPLADARQGRRLVRRDDVSPRKP